MRTIGIDLNAPQTAFSAGIQGEHRAVGLAVIPPADMPGGLAYRLAFDPGGMSETLESVDGEIFCALPASVTAHESVSMTLEGYKNEERLYKSHMVTLFFGVSAQADNTLDGDAGSMGAEVAANTAARHSHSNQSTLDRLGETQGRLTYNGEPFTGEKGEKGDKGDKGDKGETPERGVDYWTQADKAEIVADVLAALPMAQGVLY